MGTGNRFLVLGKNKYSSLLSHLSSPGYGYVVLYCLMTLLSSKIGFALVLLDSSSIVPVILRLYFSEVRHSSIQSQWEMNFFS